MFFIMKSAEKTEIRKLTIQNAKNPEPSNIKTKDHEKPDLKTIDEENWKTKKRCKILQKYEDNPTKNWEEKAEIRTHIEPLSQIIDNKVDIKQEATADTPENTGSQRLQLNEESNLSLEERETAAIKKRHAAGFIQNQLKEIENPSEIITEESMKKKALKNAIENSIAKIMDTHECSENMAQKAINEVFNERGQRIEREVIQKIKI